MSLELFDWLARGFTQAAYWQMAIYLLVVTQVTIFTVTLYLHRSQAHRGVDFHPLLAHFFRFWSWLTTSMITREWAAIHRKHHAKCETEEDPHSPMLQGHPQRAVAGVELYRECAPGQGQHREVRQGLPGRLDRAQPLYTAMPRSASVLMLVVELRAVRRQGVADRGRSRWRGSRSGPPA